MPNSICVPVIIVSHALMLGLNIHVQVNAASLKGNWQCFGKAVMRWLSLHSFNVLTWGGHANSIATDVNGVPCR